MRRLISSAILLSAFLPGTAFAKQPSAVDPGSRDHVVAASASPAGPASSVELELQNTKLTREIDKLKSEIDKLSQETSWAGRLSSRAAGLGGLVGALVALLIWLLGRRVTDTYTKTQEATLARSQLMSREQHNLKLFTDLSDDNPRTQVAAAIVLIERLAELREIELPAGNRKAELEQLSIRRVLAAVVKNDPNNTKTRRAFFKTVAEGLAKDLGALPEVAPAKLPPKSPLLGLDFQQASLAGVYWRHIDARQVDFYQADFREAGLRDACLEGAVFYEANLAKAVLRGAKLSGANFQDAKLHGADLRQADLRGANLKGALFDPTTLWPEGFDFKAATSPGP